MLHGCMRPLATATTRIFCLVTVSNTMEGFEPPEAGVWAAGRAE